MGKRCRDVALSLTGAVFATSEPRGAAAGVAREVSIACRAVPGRRSGHMASARLRSCSMAHGEAPPIGKPQIG